MSIVEKQQQAAEDRWMGYWLRGPTETGQRSLPPQVGDPAPDIQLPDMEGRTRKLSEFWADRPALVLFLRHYGCGCLAERWEQLQKQIPRFEEAGASVVAIGQAEPERTAAVAQRRRYPFPILSDLEREAYQRYGLVEGTAATILHDSDFWAGDRETGEKMLASRRGTELALVDNPWQLPGEFVVSTRGHLVHIHRYQYCEDFPPETVLLGAIKAAWAEERLAR